MPEVPIAHPATGPPEGWAAVGLDSQPSVFHKGVVGAFAWGFGLLTSDLAGQKEALATKRLWRL